MSVFVWYGIDSAMNLARLSLALTAPLIVLVCFTAHAADEDFLRRFRQTIRVRPLSEKLHKGVACDIALSKQKSGPEVLPPELRKEQRSTTEAVVPSLSATSVKTLTLITPESSRKIVFDSELEFLTFSTDRLAEISVLTTGNQNISLKLKPILNFGRSGYSKKIIQTLIAKVTMGDTTQAFRLVDAVTMYPATPAIQLSEIQDVAIHFPGRPDVLVPSEKMGRQFNMDESEIKVLQLTSKSGDKLIYEFLPRLAP